MQREQSRRWLTTNVTNFLLLFDKRWHCINLHSWRTAAFVLIDPITWVFIKHKLTVNRMRCEKKRQIRVLVQNRSLSNVSLIKKHQNLTFYFKDLGKDTALWAYPQKQPSELLSFPQNWQHQSRLQPLTSSRWFLCFLYLGGRYGELSRTNQNLYFFM